MKISDDQVQSDALVVFDVITHGGVAIVPLDVADAVIGYTENAIKKFSPLKKEVSISQVECSHRSTGLLHFIT